MNVNFKGNIIFTNKDEFEQAAEKNSKLRKVKNYLEKGGAEYFGRTPEDDILEVSYSPGDLDFMCDDIIRLNYKPGKLSESKNINIPYKMWCSKIAWLDASITRENLDDMKAKVEDMTDKVNEYYGKKGKLKARGRRVIDDLFCKVR